MATLRDLLALQPTSLPRFEGTLADALANGWAGKGEALPEQFTEWSSVRGKRGLSDMLAVMLPVEQNAAGERRMGMPGVVEALPQLPGQVAEMMRRGVTGDYQPTEEDPMTGRMYDPRQYEDAFNLAGLAATGGAPMPSPNNSLAAFSVWHGTPHKFPAERLIEKADGTRTHILAADPLPEGAKVLEELPLGRFRMDKIGTGEGVQAYGDGLYTSADRDFAKSFKDRNAGRLTIDLEGEASAMGLPLSRDARVELMRQASGKADAMTAAKQMQWASPEARALPQGKLAALIDKFRASQEGSLYKVEINAEPTDFIDWERPLAQQPEAIRKTLEAMLPDYQLKHFGGTPHALVNNKMIEVASPNALTGRDAYIISRMGQGLDDTKSAARAASQKLRDAGLPGIRFRDGGADNYVLFDDSLMKILLRE